MTEARRERLAAATGIVFVALWFAGVALDPVVDAGGDPAEVVRQRILDDQARTWGSVYATALAALALVWFGGSLRAFLRRRDPTGRLSAVAFGGGVLGGAVLVASAALWSTAVELADRAGNAGTTQVAALLGETFRFIGLPLAAALIVGPTVLLSIRAGIFPRSLEVLGVIGVALGLVFFWPLNVLGGLLTLIWFVGTSVALIARVGAPGAEAAPEDESGGPARAP